MEGYHECTNKFNKTREKHLEEIAHHYALKMTTNKEKEVQKTFHTKRVTRAEKNHKWCLKERYIVKCTLLVPDFEVHNILTVFGPIGHH